MRARAADGARRARAEVGQEEAEAAVVRVRCAPRGRLQGCRRARGRARRPHSHGGGGPPADRRRARPARVSPLMTIARRVVGGLLVLTGAVWIGQGLNLIQGSSMTGSSFWAVVGAVCVVAGLG